VVLRITKGITMKKTNSSKSLNCLELFLLTSITSLVDKTGTTESHVGR